MDKHGIIHTDQKNGWRQTKIYNNGHLMVGYRYPIITRQFYSNLINYDNLHLCGGWFLTGTKIDDECVLRVLNHTKPMGIETYLITEKEKINNIIAVIKNVLKYEKNAFIYKEAKRDLKGHACWHDVKIAINKSFVELFDLQALVHDYLEYFCKAELLSRREFPWEFLPQVERHILGFRNQRISAYLEFDYANPKTALDLITTGLVLGYPIETTASLIIRDYF
jgi:hypothetical protein